ncbi:hypothetical protein AB0958_28985 [Streptomyces sp. NPDC006655]|uniref:hypothetical protein n=1 Tax=Streptomyces sp. NPDC006655 TaxID=3156898 RepID=UPI0034542EF2
MARIVPCGEKRSINARSTRVRPTAPVSMMRPRATLVHGGARGGSGSVGVVRP